MRNIMIAVVLLLTGCKSMTSPSDVFAVGERIDYRWYHYAMKVCQVVSDGEIHAYSYDDNGRIDGLRIAIIPLNGGYVNGEYVRHGTYEYVGPYTYTLIRDANGNEGMTNTIRLFKEIPVEAR